MQCIFIFLYFFIAFGGGGGGGGGGSPTNPKFSPKRRRLHSVRMVQTDYRFSKAVAVSLRSHQNVTSAPLGA